MVSNQFATARNLTAASAAQPVAQEPAGVSLPPAFVMLAPETVIEMQQMAGWPAIYMEAYRRALAAVQAQRRISSRARHPY